MDSQIKDEDKDLCAEAEKIKEIANEFFKSKYTYPIIG